MFGHISSHNPQTQASTVSVVCGSHCFRSADVQPSFSTLAKQARVVFLPGGRISFHGSNEQRLTPSRKKQSSAGTVPWGGNVHTSSLEPCSSVHCFFRRALENCFWQEAADNDRSGKGEAEQMVSLVIFFSCTSCGHVSTPNHTKQTSTVTISYGRMYFRSGEEQPLSSTQGKQTSAVSL